MCVCVCSVHQVAMWKLFKCLSNPLVVQVLIIIRTLATESEVRINACNEYIKLLNIFRTKSVPMNNCATAVSSLIKPVRENTSRKYLLLSSTCLFSCYSPQESLLQSISTR